MAANADAVWYLYDAVAGWTQEDQMAHASFDRPVTVIANKIDLAHATIGVPVSALKGDGLEDLLASLPAAMEANPTTPLINLRHLPLLQQARASLEDCRTSIENDAPDDLLSVLLADAAQSLGTITGETATHDMIARIFHDFCIGK
jgi:tRNA U34 5-carboxymethylaminomethyl modifying GTPase MnmE/TrmE